MADKRSRKRSINKERRRQQPRTDAPKEAPPILDPRHEKLISDSAIDPEVANERGYRTVRTKAELGRLGFGQNQQKVPALLVPIYGVTGEDPVNYQIRPDEPRIKSGKPLKYELPRGTRVVLDVPRRVRGQLGDPNTPLFITEGSRKADAAVSAGVCCVALLGVWNWRGRNDHGGKVALPEWESVALEGRTVYIVFDSDVMTKPAVHAALARLKPFLESRGATVAVVYLTAGDDGAKVGLDDYLAAGNSTKDLALLARADLRVPERADGTSRFEVADDGSTLYLKRTNDDIVRVVLANFHATIVGDVVEDDGEETRRLFEIEASLRGASLRFEVPAERFASMHWATEHLGPNAIVTAGSSHKDLLREAVQALSSEVVPRRVFTSTGWIQLDDGTYAYVSASGAIGAKGLIDGVEVRMDPPLDSFDLPQPPEGEALVQAVRASLALLDGLASDHVIFPIYVLVWSSALDARGQAAHISGSTGVRKTELAALAQSHFGGTMDADNLPSGWSSTANYLEVLGFYAKDALLVVDDFCPSGTSGDVQRLNREADRLLRGQANARGRGRLRSDGSRRRARSGRGVILSTGEDVPGGHSLRARVIIVDVARGCVNLARLTECQANRELYPLAMAGFVKWAAPRLPKLRQRARQEFTRVRDSLLPRVSHGRTASIAGSLLPCFGIVLRFAIEIGAITAEQGRQLRDRAAAAVVACAEAQGAYLHDAEPAALFVEHLGAALRAGNMHLSDWRERGAPAHPDLAHACGWRYSSVGSEWRPNGPQVGWICTERGAVFLDPRAVYQPVVDRAGDAGCRITVGLRSLWKALRERGYIVSHDPEKNTKKVRLGGRLRNVLHLRVDEVVGPGDEADGDDTEVAGVPRAVPGVPCPETGKGTPEGSESGPTTPPEGGVPDVPRVPRNGGGDDSWERVCEGVPVDDADTAAAPIENGGVEQAPYRPFRGTQGTQGTPPPADPERGDSEGDSVPRSADGQGTLRGTPGDQALDPTLDESDGMPLLRRVGSDGVFETRDGELVRFSQFMLLGKGVWLTTSGQRVRVVDSWEVAE